MNQVVEVESFYRDVPLHARQLRRARGRELRGTCFRIGGGRDADAPAPIEHLLVEPHGDAYLVHTTAEMTGEVQQSGARVPLHLWVQERGDSFALPEDTQVWLRLGFMTFVIGTAEAPPAVGPPPLVFRWHEQKYLVGTAVVLAVTLLMAWFLPPDARALSFDEMRSRYRYLQARIVPPEPPPAPPGRAAGAAGGPAGQAGQGPEGAAGTTRAQRRAARLARARPARSLAEQMAERRQAVQQLAWLGRWKPDPGTAMGQLLQAGSALGEDPEDVLGALMAAPVGEAYGIGGVGVRSTGAGGGGTGIGTIGTGRLRTIGIGGGCDGDCMYDLGGHGRGRLAPRRATAPQVAIGQVQLRGSLDKDIIRRVVRRHLPEVRFCYEQELPRAPTLAGRVAVNFTIAGTGKVAAAVVQSSTLNNARAESCVVGAVRRWEFPAPQGGGIVIATYPFNFVVAGGN